MRFAKLCGSVVILLSLTGFYVADRSVIEGGECGLPAGSFACKVGGQTKPLTLIEHAAEDGSSCVYVDPSDNSEARFKRISGKLYLGQTYTPGGNTPLAYTFLEVDGRGGWTMYLQDPSKSAAMKRNLEKSIAADQTRIQAIIQKEGDISVVPDKKSGTEKLVGPKELILLVLTAHDKSVLTKVGSCAPKS